jgi:hypothetical protein
MYVINILKLKSFTDCPSGCKCPVIDIRGNNNLVDRLMVQGQHLQGIPENLPNGTAAL